MYGYKIDDNESIVFSTKKDYIKAINNLKKQGFEKITKGFYFNKITKQFCRTSEVYSV